MMSMWLLHVESVELMGNTISSANSELSESKTNKVGKKFNTCQYSTTCEKGDHKRSNNGDRAPKTGTVPAKRDAGTYVLLYVPPIRPEASQFTPF